MTRLLVVGDCLLDQDVTGTVERLAAEAPVPVVENARTAHRPGGAGLAACLAAAAGCEVTLVTALCRDGAGEQLLALLEQAGVDVLDLGLTGRTPEKVRIMAAGRTLLRLDQSDRDGQAVGDPGADVLAAIAAAPAILVSDYGFGVAGARPLREALAGYAERAALVWDPHPRGAEPVPSARLVKPNRREAGAPDDVGRLARRAEELRRRWRARGVAVTCGSRGAVLVTGDGPPLVASPPEASDRDPCGAGDSFSVAAARHLAEGASLPEAVVGAVRAASRFVAAGGAAACSPPREPEPAARPRQDMRAALELAASVRARGGRVVAAGGCFDVLHAGHVRMLSEARALGDALVVLLNSDRSVRRLKGPGRPAVPARERALVLSSLACVDAVVTFDEDTPVEALRALRPDVFAKGGDYAARRLPERAAMAEWGGEVVVLPHVRGWSTTKLLNGRIAQRA